MDPIISQRPCRPRDRPGLAVLVVAAGASRRLGRPKQAVRIHGEPLVRRITRIARSVRPGWLGVVVGARADLVRAALAGTGTTIVRAPAWRSGLAASLAAGVRAAPRSARHLLVLAADQWCVTPADLWRLLHAAGPVPAAAAYDGAIGIPAVFPARQRRDLLGLRGDRGARALLRSRPVIAVPMPRAAFDLDTPDDLARLRADRARTCA